jgi:hypothetical protein
VACGFVVCAECGSRRSSERRVLEHGGAVAGLGGVKRDTRMVDHIVWWRLQSGGSAFVEHVPSRRWH